VFVVASARDDINPTEILFEFEGLRRDTPQSRKTGQEVTGTIAARFGISRNNIEECVSVVGALDTECGGTKMNHQTIASGHIFPVKSFYESSLAQYREDTVSGTIKASGGVAGGGSETFLAQPVAVYENHPADSRVKEMGEVCSTVVSRWGTGGGNLLMVSQPIAFTTEQTPKFNDDQALTLTKSESKHNQCVAQPMVWDTTNITSPQNGSNPQPGDPCFTLAKGQHPPLLTSMAVRRLTPTECERLQGFPDNYTNIPWRKAAESPDGPRYKALGNSWAVPVVAWIGQRIQDQIK
jgi:DNA (cytosine-5)-methyltransferase 1